MEERPKFRPEPDTRFVRRVTINGRHYDVYRNGVWKYGDQHHQKVKVQ